MLWKVPEGHDVQEQAGHHLTAQKRYQRGDEAGHRRDGRLNHREPPAGPAADGR